MVRRSTCFGASAVALVEVEGAPVDATVKGAPAEAEAMVKEVSPTLREAGT